MEIANAFGHGNGIKKAESGGGDDDSSCKEDVLIKIGKYGKNEHENEEKTSSSDQFKSCSKTQDDESLESARVEMGEVMEENQRLKMSLNKIMKDYETLRMQFLGMVKQDHEKIKLPEETDKETELVSLSLGRFPIKKDDKGKETNNELPLSVVKENLSLRLDSKFEQETKAGSSSPPNRSLTNSYDQEGAAKEEAGETWPPSKAMKHMRSGEDSEVTQNNPPKKARVCVRARCETTTMNDGCQWRKYGQKIAKGNPCPRAYYRCTGSPTCPVRKQVQRCADDMSILITTYEGNHNHPLAVSATAMASTTSAAVSMLLSGSSSSSSISTPSSVNLQGLNFYLSGNNNNNNNLNLKQFYLPNSSISSTSPTHPTITLDLTSSNPSSSSTSSSSHFSKFPNARYPFTSNLDFGSSRNNTNNNNNNVLSWNNNNNNNLISYPNNQALYNRNYNQIENYLQKNNVISSSTDTIAAATKAITADPSFQSALAAALTSLIGNGGERLKSQAPFQLSSYGNNHQMMKGNGNMVFNNVPSNGLSLPFSTSKSASASPAEHIDLTN